LRHRQEGQGRHGSRRPRFQPACGEDARRGPLAEITAMRGAMIAGLLALTGAAAAPDFAYDPTPRWAQDPGTDVVCAAIRAECAGKFKGGDIDTEWSYAELYNAGGMLVGLRSLQSSG